MTPNQALIRLQRGLPVDCVTPDGVSFQIQVRFDKCVGLPWYRARPLRKGCLRRYSRLSDRHVLEWLEAVTIIDHRGVRIAPDRSEAVSGAESGSEQP